MTVQQLCRNIYFVFIILEHFCLFASYAIVYTFVCCSPAVPNIPHKAELQSAFPRDEMEYFDWKSSSVTFPKFAKLLSLPSYTYQILLGLTVSAGGLTESLVRFHLVIVTGPPNGPVCFAHWHLLSVVVCRRRLSSFVTLPAGGPAAGRVGGRAANIARHASMVTSY